ncbi:MAG: sigma-54 dependent transcriptional regulator [Woeseiaceae bacterium]
MEKTGNILIVDDDDDILTAGRLLLRRDFANVITCRDPEAVPRLLSEHAIDAVLLDMNFGPGESSGQQGLAWLSKILEIDADLVVVMITAHGSLNNAIEAMKRGATDFIVKPWQNEKVVATVSTAVKLSESRRQNQQLRQTNRALQQQSLATGTDIIGDSAAMREVMRMVDRAAPTDANVLILGENGTGKELVARELHRRSARAEHAFLTVDMGSISESLFESELFGHRKGAFTDASDDRLGRFQAANHGTLFLDEIGNLPLNLQAKLLRVLEQRKVTPVGSDQASDVDIRVIAATNVPPQRLKDEQHFRQDLLYRLNTVEIVIPPLRERVDDILPIARHFAEHYARKYKHATPQFSDNAITAMNAYEWPGNVRALRHAIERAIILGESGTLDAGDLQLTSTATASHKVSIAPTILNLDHMEKDTIRRALTKHGFNISRAASELGLTRASLYRRMEKHDL